MSEVINWLLNNGVDVLTAVLSIVGGAAVLAKYTKNPTDDKFLGGLLIVLRKILDFVGQNGGHAENKTKPGSKQ